ncbi:diguanylate cyclase domain-containing protein [Shewanella benthica]
MLKETDIAARLGGDEFAILLEYCKSSIEGF